MNWKRYKCEYNGSKITCYNTISIPISFFVSFALLTVTHDDIMTSHDISHFLLYVHPTKLRLTQHVRIATKGTTTKQYPQYLENPNIKLISNYSHFYCKKKKGTSTVVINQPYLGFHTNVFRYFQ